MIELADVRIGFLEPDGRRTQVLKGIDLSLARGQFALVVGANGCGKSTLLNVVAGKCLPDAGRILFDGRDVAKLAEYKRAKFVGRVFQNPLHGTCPTMSIAENMRLAELRGQRRGLALGLGSAARSRYREALAVCRMGLEDRLSDMTGALSGGQRQALTLILATLAKPTVLLLDEHTAALDPRAADHVANLTEQLVREHQLTALMVTHSMQQAVTLGDRTLLMHNGQIVDDYQGDRRVQITPADLVQRLGELYQSDLVTSAQP